MLPLESCVSRLLSMLAIWKKRNNCKLKNEHLHFIIVFKTIVSSIHQRLCSMQTLLSIANMPSFQEWIISMWLLSLWYWLLGWILVVVYSLPIFFVFSLAFVVVVVLQFVAFVGSHFLLFVKKRDQLVTLPRQSTLSRLEKAQYSNLATNNIFIAKVAVMVSSYGNLINKKRK